MYQRSFLFLIMLISFTGCEVIHKTQILNVAPMPVSNQEILSAKDDEKVWVETETQKVWVNNHVDDSGEMVEGHYKHIIVTPGHWAVKDSGKK